MMRDALPSRSGVALRDTRTQPMEGGMSGGHSAGVGFV
jgi:hypothetical protein